MSDDDLVERVARAIRARVWLSDIGLDLDMVKCASMAVRSIASIEAAGYAVVPREQTERYKRALEQCAADCVLPPGIFNDVCKYITKEFSRRIKLANDALSDAALEKDKADVG